MTTGEVAGFTPDHEVHGSKRSTIRCIILCVTLISLAGLAVVVVLAVKYAHDPPGLIVYPSNFVVLESRYAQDTKAKEYIDVMNAFADKHKESMISGEHLVHCSFNKPSREGEECRFEINWFGNECSQWDNWGYKNYKPCFILVFNDPKDWVPEPYTSPHELPEEMPESLRQHIRDYFDHHTASESRFLWVSCSGDNPADTEYMGESFLTPWQGIPDYYFPIREDTSPSAMPLLALQLPNVEYGVLIGIKCHFWAKNLKPPYVAASIELLM